MTNGSRNGDAASESHQAHGTAAHEKTGDSSAFQVSRSLEVASSVLVLTPGYTSARYGPTGTFENEACPVASVRAVVGPPEQRCWIERQQVVEGGRGDANPGGALVGAIIGGVLGHQVGGGRGKDAATAGGAVAGALIGGNAGGGAVTYDKDVQRCKTVASGRPEYWDVTYI